MSLPPRVFYTMTEAAARWGCAPADIAAWAAVGRLEIVTGISPTKCGDDIVAGLVIVAAADLLPMFRRCGGGPGECLVRRVREAGAEDWTLITEPQGGLLVDKADLMIMADEVARFEDEFGIFRRMDRGGGGAGPSVKYDWDGFYLQVILRIHEDGLPETQGELVGQMQQWFVEKTDDDGDVPDESTIRRRVSPIWRALRGRA